MASKQLGRLRQWAGEVISSRDSKSLVGEEFLEIEDEIEMRKEGMSRLRSAAEAYHRSLSKKKVNGALESNEKYIPIDALGIVMIVHGEQIGTDSPFGASLVKLGRAHCKVATLQEAYAVTFKDTFIASIQRFTEDIKEFENLKKKLDSRGTTYEAALSKVEKLRQGKKDKDRFEAEEEMERAKQRFDETVQDLHAYMDAIKDDEAHQLRDLSMFLDLEINFAQQYLEVLKDVKSDWAQETNLKKPKRHNTSSSVSLRSSNTNDPSGSLRSNKSSDTSVNEINSRLPTTRSRLSSISNGSKPPSRPSSRASRKRTNSSATDKSDKDKEPGERARRLSVASWASSAMDSMTSRGKKNTKDKDSFASLNDDDETRQGKDSLKKSSSIGSFTRRSSKKSDKASPSLVARDVSLTKEKLVRAKLDYQAKSSSEISFQAGDEILVVNEVLDAWWMGELRGRKGLFPTSHVDVIRPRQTAKSEGKKSDQEPGLVNSSADDDLTDDYGSVDLDEERDLTARPLSHSHNTFLGGGLGDEHSILSQADDNDDDDDDSLPAAFDLRVDSNVMNSGNVSTRNLSPQEPSTPHRSPISTGTKRAPPPPPPRRPVSTTPAAAPPLPERRVSTRTHRTMPSNGSLSSSVKTSSTASLPVAHSDDYEGYDRSPFESTTDLAMPEVTPATPRPKGGDGKQNPFHVW